MENLLIILMIRTKRHRIQPPAEQVDHGSLADIYDAYHLPIYRTIFRQVGDVETARDLTADCFQRLLQALQVGKGPNRDNKAWLYRTAHNLVVDYYRRRALRDHDPLDKNIAANGPDPSSAAENNILVDIVRNALHELTPDQRQVISLKYLDGLTNKEVAAIMGRSTGAVKSLQHRALAALQRKLVSQENGPQAASIANQSPNRATKKGMNRCDPSPRTVTLSAAS